MAVNTVKFTLGGQEYTEYIGTNDTDDPGQSVHYIEEAEVNPRTGKPDIWQPVETYIKRKNRGGVASILTIFERVGVGQNGEIIRFENHKQNRLYRWYANPQDILFFIGGLGMAVMQSETNLFVRRGKGYNYMPVYASQDMKDAEGNILFYRGQQIQYPVERQNDPAEKTDDYEGPKPPPLTLEP